MLSPALAGASTPDPWRVAVDLSPVPHIRVDPGREHSYVATVPVTNPDPGCPWAIHLASPHLPEYGVVGGYHYLTFDLDAGQDPARAHADAAGLRALLVDHGFNPVVCSSGPRGGRHVWAAIDGDPLPAGDVASMATMAKALFPSLDTAPLRNEASGCVRPPGAPHRAGGASMILSGSLEDLYYPTGTRIRFRALWGNLASLAGGSGHSPSPAVHQPLRLDGNHVFLPGPRDPELPAYAWTALTEAPVDASAALWRILLGAAAARWRHSDMERLTHMPGMAHVVSIPDGRGGRRRRPKRLAERVLARQWDKAVRHVAARAPSTAADPKFAARSAQTTAAVEAAQARARACPGRWRTGGGPADRRILDALCHLALTCVRPTVDADIRRLALMAGLGRETARVALQRLAGDRWIEPALPAEGNRSASWSLVIHRRPMPPRSQEDPPPAVLDTARRLALAEIAPRLALYALDAPTALPAGAGTGYAHLSPTLPDPDPPASSRMLALLSRLGLARRTAGGWVSDPAPWELLARHWGVAGVLAGRQARYAQESAAWAEAQPLALAA